MDDECNLFQISDEKLEQACRRLLLGSHNLSRLPTIRRAQVYFQELVRIYAEDTSPMPGDIIH